MLEQRPGLVPLRTHVQRPFRREQRSMLAALIAHSFAACPGRAAARVPLEHATSRQTPRQALAADAVHDHQTAARRPAPPIVAPRDVDAARFTLARAAHPAAGT